MIKEHSKEIQKETGREKYRGYKKGWRRDIQKKKIRKAAREQGANKKLREINDVPPCLDQFISTQWDYRASKCQPVGAELRKERLGGGELHEGCMRTIISLPPVYIPYLHLPPLLSLLPGVPSFSSLLIRPLPLSPRWKLKYSLITCDTEACVSTFEKTYRIYVCLSSHESKCVIHCPLWNQWPGQRFMDWIFSLYLSRSILISLPHPLTPGCCVTIESS